MDEVYTEPSVCVYAHHGGVAAAKKSMVHHTTTTPLRTRQGRIKYAEEYARCVLAIGTAMPHNPAVAALEVESLHQTRERRRQPSITCIRNRLIWSKTLDTNDAAAPSPAEYLLGAFLSFLERWSHTPLDFLGSANPATYSWTAFVSSLT